MTPDFIIGGAPKCGTTSLHKILDQHPDVWMAPNEVYFFDADDPIAHGDFLGVNGTDLEWRDPTTEQVKAWYEARFSAAPEGAFIGEDTTTYLMSDVAPFRIKGLNPRVKIIFVLRDPVQRAFSQYWHLLRTGRTVLSFEAALSAEPSIILGSTYTPRLRQFRAAMGSGNIHVVVFEAFNTDRQAQMHRITDFLGLSRMSVETEETWHNRTRYPKRLSSLQRLNRLGRHLVPYRYARHLNRGASFKARTAHRAYRKWFHYVSERVLTQDVPPEGIRAKTRSYLSRHLSDRNAGLSDMLGFDLSDYWADFTS
ncbi:MAG: sulfotransferase [Pseudomonadota bacterium]